jgi:hypothetical protein
VLGATLTIALCGFHAACFKQTVHTQEASRVTSPDGENDLILFTREGGAGTSRRYFMEVVPRGAGVDPGAPFLEAHHLPGAYQDGKLVGPASLLTGRWVSANNLEILLPKCTVWKQSGSCRGASGESVHVRYTSVLSSSYE